MPQSYTKQQWLDKFAGTEVESLFDFYDKDGSGTIDPDEWLKGNEEMIEQMKAKKAEEEAERQARIEAGEEDEEEEDEEKEGEEKEEPKAPPITMLNDLHHAHDAASPCDAPTRPRTVFVH